MKKSYKRLIIFDIILTIILLLNSFILNILGNYYYMDIFLIVLLILFKFIFGIEKDRHRYIKDILINIIIIYLISFIFYYLFGLIIGFYRPDNYLTLYGFGTFILPFTVMVIIREYLRMQMLYKTEKSKILTILTIIIFILLELSVSFGTSKFSTNYNVFIYIALTVLPVISNNIACTYIAKKVGYKANILWILIAKLYLVLLPIIPNSGLYITSIIELLFPFVLIYNIYTFYKKRDKDIPISYIKKRIFYQLPILIVIVGILVYFVSGNFRYYAVAIATGSMKPKIEVGDVVIIDQEKDYKKLKVGDIIAYKYHGIVVVHRISDIVVIKKEYYFYTKGDANEDVDNYIIYPKTILGDVRFKIPAIGIPTVWLNDLLK